MPVWPAENPVCKGELTRCHSCGRMATGDLARRGWRARGELIFCMMCRRRNYRLRSITMTVAADYWKPQGELCRLLEHVCDQPGPFRIANAAWMAAIEDGKPAVHVSVADRWWRLLIDDGAWSRGRKSAYAKITSGEAVAGDLFLSQQRNEILCKTKAWLPREQSLNEIVGASQLRQRVRSQQPDKTSLGGLRQAIRSNLVSFPSQLPVSPDCTEPDLQRRLVLLYFVFGWSFTRIADRYSMSAKRVRRMVESWRVFAVRAGYVEKVSGCKSPNMVGISSETVG